MPLLTPRAALAAALLGLPLAASAQPNPPPGGNPVGTVTVDGTLTDSPYTLLATDGGRTELGFGPDNQLNAIYAAADAGRLNIGLAGIVNRAASNGDRNYAVVFLDTKAGGVPNGAFDRTNGPDFGNGVSNFNSGHSFDVGFTPDYALQIGCDATKCYATLFTLTATAGGGTQLYLGNSGDANDPGDPDFRVNLPSADQNSRTLGFEVSLTTSATGAGADLALDRNSVQMFALITGASGYLSDQFLTPTGPVAGDPDLNQANNIGNYAFAAINFETKPADPVSYVFQPIAGRKGWRQLAWPVTGGTVADYAAQNFVQGPNTAYPTGVSNVLVRYGSGTDYVRASGLAEPLPSGRGQLWYHYDASDFSGGVAPAAFRPRPYTLRAGGREPQADVSTPFNELVTGFAMGGNPFSLDFDTQGIALDNNSYLPGPLVYVWDPDASTAGAYGFVDRFAAAIADRTVAPMQGFWFESRQSSSAAAGAPSFGLSLSAIYPQARRVQGNEPIVSRTASQRVLAFQLDRLTPDGPVLEWQVARLAFVEGAGEGSDAFDGGLPPAVDAASDVRVAFVGNDGEMRGQESRAYDAAATARLALHVAGRPAATTYRLTWPSVADLPESWSATLTDGDTGETVNLRTADHLDFTASEGDWTSRFTVQVAARTTAAETAPAVARLGAATPNPSSGDARVSLAVDRPQHVRAEVFDALGRRVAVVLDAAVDAPRDVVVDTRGLAPGAYVLRVTGDTFAASRRLTVAR